MFAIVGDPKFFENYALTITVNYTPNEKMSYAQIKDIARAALLPEGTSEAEGLINLAAYEVVVFLKENLMSQIEMENSVHYRLFSIADVLNIMKDALGLLRSAFRPYSSRLDKYTKEEYREICHRIAGISHISKDANILTGKGITFTGITQLYYSRTSLSISDATNYIRGKKEGTIYYINQGVFFKTVFPKLNEIEAIVASVMGTPGTN